MSHADSCKCCAGPLALRQLRARFQFQGQTIYISHVPTWTCHHCGEQYFDAPVSKRLEAIARQGECMTETVCFPLAAYDMALDYKGIGRRA
jgi:YgiT-type zinc finger domain-containing protein